MSTEYKLYPFLISRSNSHDYKVIVAPGFLVDNNLSDHLIQAAPNEKPTETGIILHRCVGFGFNNSNNFTLLYRIDIATKKDIGENSEEKLRDNNGRYINLIEGVIHQGLISEEDSRDLISHQYFQEIRRNFANDYKEFWHNKNSQTSISDSKKLSTNKNNKNTFKVQNLPTYHANTIDIARLIAFGMLVTVGIAYLVISFFL
jgi:hypothetical protein